MTAPAPPASSNWTDGPAPSNVTTASRPPSPPAVTWGAASARSPRPKGICSAATQLVAYHLQQGHQSTAQR
eukprot:3539563-Alexandrium_andersonii.AAC.1